MNSAGLETLGNFTSSSPHRFVALSFIYHWDIPNASFSTYLQEAYPGFPFVVSFGQTEFNKTRLIADLERIRQKIFPKDKPTINFPTLKKMIFVKMTRTDADPSPFEGFTTVQGIVGHYITTFAAVGLYQTFDAVIISGPMKTTFLSIIPEQLLATYPDKGQGEVQLPSIFTTTAAAILCIMMKQQEFPSTLSSISIASIQFNKAWGHYAKAIKAAVNISKSFRIGSINFTICSVVEEQERIKHFIAHCVMKSGRFVVDDMTAEVDSASTGQREHGTTTPIDKTIPWKVNAKLVMLFAVRTDDYRDKLKPRSQGKNT